MARDRIAGRPNQILNDAITLNEEPLAREEIRQEEKLTIYREHIDKMAYEVAVEKAPGANLIPANFKVPPNQIFVMGDNRCSAQDSRHIGPIRFENIVGKKL